MAKFCPNCGNELPENAAMCVKCGTMVDNTNKNKKKGLPTWSIVLIVVGCVIIIPIIVFVVLAIIGFKYIEDNDIDIKGYIEENMVSKGTIGDVLTDYETNIALTDALIYSSINGLEASDGKEYLVFFFEVENIDDDDSLYISNHSFTGFVDLDEVSSVNISEEINGYKPLGETLTKGERTKGYVIYEVNSDWKDFSIHFRRNSFDYDSIIFDVVNEDNVSNQDGV